MTNLLDRYEELVALRLSDRAGLQERLKEQGRAVLAIDGLQPDVGHEVLWVVRECLSGEVLLARSLLGGTEKELVPLLREVADALEVPDRGRRLRRAARRSARPWAALCPEFPTSCASSTTSGRRPRRSTKPTATPRRSSRRGCGG